MIPRLVEGSFQYLSSIIQDDGELIENATNNTKASWVRWTEASIVLCYYRILHRMFIRPMIMYTSKHSAYSKNGRG